MIKETKFKIEGAKSLDDKISIETEIEVLDGVIEINVNEKNGDCILRFDDSKISEQEISEKIKNIGYHVVKEVLVAEKSTNKNIKVSDQITKKNQSIKEHTFFVKGMHCASCEILIEKKLLGIEGVQSVEATTSKGQVVVEYQGEKPLAHRLSKIFEKENYVFSDHQTKRENIKPKEDKKGMNSTLVAFDIALFFIVAFLILNKMGISDFLNVSSKSSLITFVGLGLLAGISSCAALVGGIVLSMSKQWSELYSQEQTTSQKLQPHIMFNLGRVVSYAVLGGVLGLLGSKLQISVQFTSFLVIAISFLMIALGLQMLGVKAFRKFQFSLPKSVTRYIANENNFKGKQMPFVMGALTFFLPCGFTITAQSLALLSGSAMQGGLIMASFALGTVPALFLIGLSSVKFTSKPHLAEKFSKVAGFLVLFFALFNINGQMNVLGFTGFGSLLASNSSNASVASQKDLPPIIDGKQVLKMNASSSGYKPNYLKVRAGMPVRWEITDTGTSGCTNAIISRSLFEGQIDLTPGQVSVKEFTPAKLGKYKFSCWMGMVSGTIEVVNANTASNSNSGSVIQTAKATTNNNNNNNAKPSSGGSTCGGGGGGCGCGGGGAPIKKDASNTVAQVQGNTQVINAQYTANSYLTPNAFEVKAGTKVKLTINVKDDGRGCGSEIKIPGLYENATPLSAGNTINMEFTPTTPGNYEITCGMEMMNFGSIQVN